MNIVVTYIAYLVISVGLTLLVGRGLSRNGRVFLLDVLDGHDSPAEAVSNLIVVAFYLINLGFIALTMRTTADLATGRQSIQLLAAKIGEVLIVLGALYLASIMLLTRLRRRLRLQPPPPTTSALPGCQQSGATALSSQAPGSQVPGSQVPGSQVPGSQALGSQVPGSARSRVSAVAPAGPGAGVPHALWRSAAHKVTQ